ncbi:MAG: IS30 family transposase [Methylophilaceae bacterium]
MLKRDKRSFTEEEQRECWQLWRQGLGFSDIARELSSKPGTIFGVIRLNGGYSPPQHTRKKQHLTLLEREEISRGIAQGCSIRNIAAKLNRSPSTISRELSRHGGTTCYRATNADQLAWQNACRPKPCKLASSPALCDFITEKLQHKWSPQQISGWLSRHWVDNQDMQISHETIYKSLYLQARGVLKKELMKQLRYGHKMRHTKLHSTRGDRGTIRIVNGLSIRDRPPEAIDRAVPGHWEGDLISGSNNSHIATLVERNSRYTILAHLDGKDTDSVVQAITREMMKLPMNLRKTLTWDRGMEMAKHANFTIATDMAVYFCDPQSPWQRGTNENTNRLLRQYFPKKTPLEHYSQDDLDKVALELNERPRKTLGYKTPCEVISYTVALTH